MKTRSKIFALAGAAFLAMMLALCTFFSALLWNIETLLAEQRLENNVKDAACEYSEMIKNTGEKIQQNFSKFTGEYMGSRDFGNETTIWFTSPDTGTLLDGPNQTLQGQFEEQKGTNAFRVKDSFSGREYVAAAAPCMNGRLYITMPADEFNKQRTRTLALVWAVGTAVFIMSLSVSFLIARRIARSVRIIAAALERLKREDYSPLPAIKTFSSDGEKIFKTIRTLIREQSRRQTEREKNIAAVQRSQKLESIGVLAGGIAHDFNNLLTAIRGNIQLAQMFSETPETRQCLADCENATIRAAALTKQLLTFSAGGKPVKSIVSVPDLVESFASFVLRGSRTTYNLKTAPNVLPVEADSGQLGQAVDNIVINAAQSMPEGGILEITIDNYYRKPSDVKPAEDGASAVSFFPHLGVDDAQANLNLDSGAYVRISFRDSGSGIEKDNLGKIFDPFYTTKKAGNGLGLSTTYEIIRKHGGFIVVCSEAGLGTEFRIYLPASPELAGKAESHEKPKEEHGQIYKSGGNVLIMDDREDIRALLARMLAIMNCRCDFAADGEELVTKFKAAKAAAVPYDILFLDLTIPGGMGGKEVIKIIRGMDRDVKTVVASGYSNDPVIADFMDYGFNACLQKPFKITDVSIIMHRLMKKSS